MKKTIPIVFAFDNNLILPACVCLSSLLMNANENTFYDIFILHSSKVNLRRTELDTIIKYYGNCRIQYRIVDNTFDEAFEIRGITASTYYRLMIPELIPEYGKILYSDVDVIFRTDLSDFYDIDITDYYVAGVNSLSHLSESTRQYYQTKVLIDSTNIIYAGNILINSSLMLKDNVVSRFKEHVYKKYRFQDLDILNIVCQGKVKYLPPCFCLTTDISKYSSKCISMITNIWTKDRFNMPYAKE